MAEIVPPPQIKTNTRFHDYWVLGHYALSVLVLITLPFSVHLNSALIFLLFLVSGFYYFRFKPGLAPHKKVYLSWALGFYLVHFIGVLNSDNLRPATFDLEQKLSLFLFPLLWAMSPALSQKRIDWLFRSFILAVLLTCLLTYRDGFDFVWDNEEIYYKLLVHRPYLGMYCLFSIFLCFGFFQSSQSVGARILYLGLGLALVAFLGAILAKMAVLTFALVAVLLYFIHLHLINRPRLAWISAGGILGAIGLAVVISPGLRLFLSKIWHLSSFSFQEYNEVFVNSFNTRFLMWKCSFQVLSEDYNWLFGAGKGDAQALLNRCYDSYVGPSFFSELNLISHNQYLTTWLNLGLLGLVLFLANIILGFYVALKDKNLVHVAFVLMMLFLFIPESILEVQKGVVFFGFFNALFLFGRNQRGGPVSIQPKKEIS
jgi:O-antigen ligase